VHNARPSHLYKYKNFSVDSLDLLVSDKLYFADPSTFNDPLDCKPSVINNIDDIAGLEDIFYRLFVAAHKKELNDAAKKIKYNGPKTLERISKLGDMEATKLIGRIAENHDFFGDSIEKSLLIYIEKYLLQGYDNGVLSLAENFDCPLMWSHYADQHRGFCFGYDIAKTSTGKIQPINYYRQRTITTQQILDMLDGKENAKKEIDDAVLLSKAKPWKYEKEWRYIHTQGLHDSNLNLTDVTFGLRFKESAKYAVMQALSQRPYPVKFYEMKTIHGEFTLERTEVHEQDFVRYPDCNQYYVNSLEDVRNDYNDNDDDPFNEPEPFNPKDTY